MAKEESYLIKLQSKSTTSKYTSEFLSLPKQFLDKIIKKFGDKPVMFKVSMDKKGRVIYEPKFLK
ncbi:MAG: hypothetical protein WC356_04360 [Candidatus Micrarchaeia archaeon]|jgi:hypothetical protein